MACKQQDQLLQGVQQQTEEQDEEDADLQPMVPLSLLTLHIGAYEDAFWSSDIARRASTTTDSLAASYAIALNGLVLFQDGRKLSRSSSSLQHVALFMAAFVVLAVLQLCFIYARPALHHKHRLRITLGNRSLRLLMLAGSSFRERGDAVVIMTQLAARGSWMQGDWLGLGWAWATVCALRPFFSYTTACLAHANFILPFRWVVWFQLTTAALSFSYVRSAVCFYATASTGVQALSADACRMLQLAAHNSGVLFGMSAHSSAVVPSVDACGDAVSATVQLLLFIHAAILVLLPCLCVYCMEWSLKDRFVLQQLRRRLAWPWPESLMMSLCLFVTGLVASWHVCAAVTNALPTMHCDASFNLQWGDLPHSPDLIHGGAPSK